MRSRVAGLAVAAIASIAVAPRASAQRVRGTLTDSVTREPIRGAVVTLTDSAGNMLSRGIADMSGAWSAIAMKGVRGAHIVRIGYRPRDLRLTERDTVIMASMQPIPARLGAIAASDTRICPGNTAASDALELWEQARAGLLASVVAREIKAPRVRLRSYRRTLDPVTRRPVGDTIEYRDLVADRSFVAARAPWVFAESGYLFEYAGGTRDYYAPDENVLLDRTFVATHCLRVVEGRGPRAAQVGIAFEPIRAEERAEIPDVDGVLWLDRATLQLRALEYHYTNVEREAREAGGMLDFAQMPTGVPMIERWSIHSPMLAFDDNRPEGSRPIPRAERRNVRVLGYRETGGQIAFASWDDGAVWRSTLPHLRGTVTDQSGKPVANAFVWLRDTPDTARTGPDGRWEMPPVPPGRYFVFASDSMLARAAVPRSLPQVAMVFADQAPELKMNFYSRAQVLPSLCPRNSYRPGTGVLLARVIDAAGEPVPNAEIRLETSRLLVKSDTIVQPQSRVGTAGDDGSFVVCGISHERPIVVRAFKGRQAGGVAVERWGDEVITVAIPIRPITP